VVYLPNGNWSLSVLRLQNAELLLELSEVPISSTILYILAEARAMNFVFTIRILNSLFKSLRREDFPDGLAGVINHFWPISIRISRVEN